MSQDATAIADPFGLLGTMLEGRFRVERHVAEGGFGVVYFGHQVTLDRPVAIKVLKTPPGLDENAAAEFRDKFAAEAKTVARIKHPHIVDVYDFGVSRMPAGPLAPWMALEWLPGQTLEADLAARRGRGGRAPAEVLRLVEPVLDALVFVHRQGIAHRDIKPGNIMLVDGPTGRTVKLLDFGIAKLMAGDDAPGTGMTKTASGLAAFSPAYASPEQVSFGRTGPWTDVHAMGLVICELLTDQPALAGEHLELFQQVVAPERPTPKTRGRDVGAWEPVLAKALAVQPMQRWKDAAELTDALRAHVPAEVKTSSTDPMASTIPASMSTSTPIVRTVRTGGVRSFWPAIAVAMVVGTALAIWLGTRSQPEGTAPPEPPPVPAAKTPETTHAAPPPTPPQPAPRPKHTARRPLPAPETASPPPAPPPPVPKKPHDFVVE